MGIFSNLLQQTQIISESSGSSSLERRIERLEQELHRTQTILHRLVDTLEHQNDEPHCKCNE